MNLEFITLGGYGFFVWPAFIFTFICCYFLYSKTRKEFKKQEKIYLSKYGKFEKVKIKTTEKDKAPKEVLSGSSI